MKVVYCDRIVCSRKAAVRGRYENRVRNFCKPCAKQLAGWKDTTIDRRSIKRFAERIADLIGKSPVFIFKKYRTEIIDGYFTGKHVGDLADELQLIEQLRRKK